ncbi:MAG: FkbM family methyltransferase [Thermoleophilaceae bacterium]|nr:FkbM family methyltransferase [Thermoleophilaceae bacterium]
MRLAFVALRVTQGPRSFLAYLRLSRIRHHTGSNGRVVRMRLRPLGGREVLIRPSTSDVDTIWGAFAGQYHREPPEAVRPALIWDLGANIGLTMADLAERHPGARVVGLEMDPENAALARHNTRPWGERCEVIQAAAWPRDGELRYLRLAGATSGHRVTDAALHADPAVATAYALSPYSLLALEGPEATVDYAKVDIEGAESELLRDNAGWTRRVLTIAVEVHDPYSVSDCEHDLQRLGFTTRVDPRHWACVIGVRDGTAPSVTAESQKS